MEAILIAILSSLSFSIGALFFKINILKKGGNKLYQLGLFLSSTIILWCFTLYNIKPTFHVEYFFSSLVIGISLLFSNIFFMKSLYLIPVGILTPLVNLNVVIIIIFSIFYYGENLGFLEYIGILFLLLGLLVFNGQLRRNHANNWISLVVIISSAIFFMIVRNGGLKITFENGLSNILVLTYSHTLALVLITIIVFYQGKISIFELPYKNTKENSAITIKRGLLGGSFSSIGLLLYGLALERGNASIILPIFSSYVIILLALSTFFLHERMSISNYLSFVFLFVGTGFIIGF
ncbi:MAG: EamA family transporter [Cellulophaga sp.]